MLRGHIQTWWYFVFETPIGIGNQILAPIVGGLMRSSLC
jgi:hypothetical protein